MSTFKVILQMLVDQGNASWPPELYCVFTLTQSMENQQGIIWSQHVTFEDKFDFLRDTIVEAVKEEAIQRGLSHQGHVLLLSYQGR